MQKHRSYYVSWMMIFFLCCASSSGFAAPAKIGKTRIGRKVEVLSRWTGALKHELAGLSVVGRLGFAAMSVGGPLVGAFHVDDILRCQTHISRIGEALTPIERQSKHTGLPQDFAGNPAEHRKRLKAWDRTQQGDVVKTLVGALDRQDKDQTPQHTDVYRAQRKFSSLVQWSFNRSFHAAEQGLIAPNAQQVKTSYDQAQGAMRSAVLITKLALKDRKKERNFHAFLGLGFLGLSFMPWGVLGASAKDRVKREHKTDITVK